MTRAGPFVSAFSRVHQGQQQQRRDDGGWRGRPGDGDPPSCTAMPSPAGGACCEGGALSRPRKNGAEGQLGGGGLWPRDNLRTLAKAPVRTSLIGGERDQLPPLTLITVTQPFRTTRYPTTAPLHLPSVNTTRHSPSSTALGHTKQPHHRVCPSPPSHTFGPHVDQLQLALPAQVDSECYPG